MLDPKRIFLIDGIGALITATLLLAILAQFESTFGMPRRILFLLAGIACIFAVYSLACYIKLRDNWTPFLRAIAIANLAYCVLTLTMVIVYRAEVTRLGVAYFIAEISVVLSLAFYEFISAHRVAGR
ncbi:MAG TPA: hypothetical protein PKD26_01070 [Pyrinomonadaceae bacterium]|nr:hypothetical protein [Pyrinomonadaceae bacterium]